MTISFGVAAKAVSSLLILIAVGFYGAKVGILDAPMSKKLSTLTIQLAQPFMLFNAFMNVEYSKEKLHTGFLILGLSLVTHIILAVFAYFAAKYRRDKTERKITEYSLLFVNAGFIGFPILEKLLGETGLFWDAFYVFVFNLLVWSYGMKLFSRGRGDIKMNVRKMLINYGSVPCMAGFLFYILQIPIPTPVSSAIGFMNNLCTPLVMLVIGANLSRLPFKTIFADAGLYLFTVLKLFVAPCLVALILHLCGLGDDYVLFFGIVAGLPTAAVTVLFAEMYDERPDLASKTVSISTVLSMFSIPVLVLLLNLILKL